MQDGSVIDRLTYRRLDDAGVRRASGVHSDPLAAAIAVDEGLQPLACALGFQFHS